MSEIDSQRSGPATPLDELALRLLTSSGFRFAVAEADADRDTCFRLRYQAVIDRSWAPQQRLGDGIERDEYDDHAVQVIGWDGDRAVATGRLVLPPGPLPTQDACGIVVEPAGHVVDVGRMAVAPTHQGPGHGSFVALLCALYLEARARGFEVACGMMSTTTRGLLRHLGVQLQVLGEPRGYWNEERCPVRFRLADNELPLSERWSGSS